MENINDNNQLSRLHSDGDVKRHQTVIDCIEMMRQTIDHGTSWKTQDIALILQCKPESVVFGARIAEVSKYFEETKGYHLTTRGKNGLEYFVEDLKTTIKTVKKWQRDASNFYKRSFKYASAAVQQHSELLSEHERRKLEKEAEIAAKRYLFATSVKCTIKHTKQNPTDNNEAA